MIGLLQGILQLTLSLLGLVIRLRLWPLGLYALLFWIIPSLSNWYAANTSLARGIFWGIAGLILLSWVYTGVKLLVLLHREKKQDHMF